MGKTPFGAYWIDRKVAIGGMAEIFHATDAHGHEVAIKKIHPDLAMQEKFVQMFLDEVRIVIQLNHAHIVQLLDFGLADGSYFFSMEWIDGKSFSEILAAQKKAGTPLPVDVGLWMMRDVCEGLHHAHTKLDRFQKPMSLVHRDISPPNIMATREGVFKVADFGIAHVRDKNVRTQPGIIRGKFSYMSPEQSLGKELDHRSDIFSAGIVLYEALSGGRLFLRKNEIETLDAVRKCEVASIRSRRAEVPEAVDALLRRALAPAPTQRQGDAAEIARETDRILAHHYPHSTRATVVEHFRAIFPEEKFKGAARPPRSRTATVVARPKAALPEGDWRETAVRHRYWVSLALGCASLAILEIVLRVANLR